MSAFLIDDAGKVWPARPETIARRFGQRTRRDFVQWAVALGFVLVTFGEAGARVALRPHFVTQEAEIRLADILDRRKPARVAISNDAQLSSWELISGVSRVTARVARLIAEARHPSPRPLLTAQRLPLERCFEIAGGQLSELLQIWRQHQGRWEPDFHERLRQRGLLAGTAIARQPGGSGRLVIDHWGAKLTTYGKDWIRIARGRDYEAQPNSEIGRSEGARQRQILAEGVPQFTASDFVFRNIDGDLVRLSFHGLGLPWRTSDGAAVVTAIIAGRRTVVLDRQSPES
jgi:hypothetical protein